MPRLKYSMAGIFQHFLGGRPAGRAPAHDTCRQPAARGHSRLKPLLLGSGESIRACLK
jgi:hypothetical protein